MDAKRHADGPANVPLHPSRVQIFVHVQDPATGRMKVITNCTNIANSADNNSDIQLCRFTLLPVVLISNLVIFLTFNCLFFYYCKIS